MTVGLRVLVQRGVGESYKFTGKERDTESGLDMFGARYYGSSLGRFMTPDWAARDRRWTRGNRIGKRNRKLRWTNYSE
jgi:RHS repeat-associated protein